MSARAAVAAVLLLLCPACLLAVPAICSAAGVWLEVPPPVSGEDVDILCAVDARTAWAACRGSLWRTSDGGGHWAEVKPPAPGSTLVGAVAGDAAWVAGPADASSHDRPLFFTADAGESWQELAARVPATSSWYVPWGAPGDPEYHEHWTSQSVTGPWLPDTEHGWLHVLWQRWVWPEEWGWLYSDLGYETRLVHTTDGGGSWHTEYDSLLDLSGTPLPDSPYVLGPHWFPQPDASLMVGLAWPAHGLCVALAPDGSVVRWLAAAPSAADGVPAILAVAPDGGRAWWGESPADPGATENLWWSDDGGATWTRLRVGGLRGWRAWDLCLLGDGQRGFLLLGLEDGSRTVYATTDGGATWAPGGLSFTPAGEGAWRFAPGSGGCAAWLYGPGVLRRYVEDPEDTLPPVSAVTGADDEWHTTAVTLTFTASDGRGTAVAQHRLLGRPWRVGTTLTLSPGRRGRNSGVHTVEYRAFDASGNLETMRRCVVRLDARPPRTVDDAPALPLATDTVVHFTASDADSGVAFTCWAVDGGVWHCGDEALLRVSGKRRLSPGLHLLSYFSVDVAGNVEPLRVVPVEVAGSLQPV